MRDRCHIVTFLYFKNTLGKEIWNNSENHLIFVDLKETYDRIPISKLFEMLVESKHT